MGANHVAATYELATALRRSACALPLKAHQVARRSPRHSSRIGYDCRGLGDIRKVRKIRKMPAE